MEGPGLRASGQMQAHTGFRPGGLRPQPELQGVAFQLSLRAGGGAGGGFSGGAGALRRQNCLSLRAGTKK